MKYEQAVSLITKVCAGYNGNYAEHQLIQQALGIVLSKKSPVEVKVPAKISKKKKK